MAKIAVVCAAGKEGRLLVEEAIARGHEVTGFVRSADQAVNPAAKKVVKDLFDITAADLEGFDVVIDAFGACGSKTRLLVVGGAGSLYVNKEHTLQVKDLDSFPEAFKPLANMQGLALADLRKRDDVLWTFLSPAGDFVADGERTGEYLLGGEEYFVNDKGESRISYADYAIAMIDETESAAHVKQRFSVIGK